MFIVYICINYVHFNVYLCISGQVSLTGFFTAAEAA